MVNFIGQFGHRSAYQENDIGINIMFVLLLYEGAFDEYTSHYNFLLFVSCMG